jgi:predicted nucleic acid-binding Zn ribbon protein
MSPFERICGICKRRLPLVHFMVEEFLAPTCAECRARFKKALEI